jgi:hypothetical protein
MSSSTWHAISLRFFALAQRLLLLSVSGHMNYLKFAVEELAFLSGNHCSFQIEITSKQNNCTSVFKQQPC